MNWTWTAGQWLKNWARSGSAHYHQTHSLHCPLIVEVCFCRRGSPEFLLEFTRRYSTFLRKTFRFYSDSKVPLQSLFRIDFRFDYEKWKKIFDRKIWPSRAWLYRKFSLNLKLVWYSIDLSWLFCLSFLLFFLCFSCLEFSPPMKARVKSFAFLLFFLHVLYNQNRAWDHF